MQDMFSMVQVVLRQYLCSGVWMQHCFTALQHTLITRRVPCSVLRHFRLLSVEAHRITAQQNCYATAYLTIVATIALFHTLSAPFRHTSDTKLVDTKLVDTN
jgi:hypothetical protein